MCGRIAENAVEAVDVVVVVVGWRACGAHASQRRRACAVVAQVVEEVLEDLGDGVGRASGTMRQQEGEMVGGE